MKVRKTLRIPLRLTLRGAVLALVSFGVGMLPGHIEGIYRGMGGLCGCNSVNFLQFRDGKVIMFSSNHPPAKLLGRYEARTDGSVSIFMGPYKEGESEKLSFTAIPRFGFSKFTSVDDNDGEWYWKSPVYGIVGKTIADQEISWSRIKADRTIVTAIYSSALEVLRTETKQPNERASNGEPATRSKSQ